jgi:cobalt/nickel transport system permease protein
LRNNFIDQFSEGDTFIHRLDPRLKFLGVLVFIAAVALTPAGAWLSLGLFSLLLAGLLLFSRVPTAFLFKRSLMVVPFMLMIIAFIPFIQGGEIVFEKQLGMGSIAVTQQGVILAGTLLLKAWLSVLAMAGLMATTRAVDLLSGMQRLKLPALLIMMGSFMYRYLFVLTDEVLRLKQARDSRHFGGNLVLSVRSTGHMAGSLFIRSFERGERIYAAMVSRGFNGRIQTLGSLSLRRVEVIYALLWLTAVIAVSIQSHRGWF